MPRAIITWLLAALCSSPLSLAVAAVDPVPPKTPSNVADQQPQAAELSKPAVGPVHSARAILGTEISEGDRTFGQIQDLSLDIGQGVVQGVYFRPIKPLDEKQDSMLLPITQFQWPEGEGRVSLGAKLEKSVVDPKQAKNSPAELILLSKSANIRVLDGRGQPIGHVVDFGLARQKGQIAYAVLHLGHSDNEKDADSGAHEKVYAIPLAAFLAKRESPDWTLDLPEKMLAEIPSFKENGAWPKVIAGTWTEYIHVRYGRSVLGGVQIEDKKFDDGGRTNPAEDKK